MRPPPRWTPRREQDIQHAIERTPEGRTTIIAHRLSTIRSADRILFIAEGGIAEEGNHQSLMKKRGLGHGSPYTNQFQEEASRDVLQVT